MTDSFQRLSRFTGLCHLSGCGMRNLTVPTATTPDFVVLLGRHVSVMPASNIYWMGMPSRQRVFEDIVRKDLIPPRGYRLVTVRHG